jgi:hypothetical protein
MKKALLFLTFLVIGIGLAYYYHANSEFKSNLDNWLGFAKYDSAENAINLDTIGHMTQRTKKHKTRERIPKKLKPAEFDKLDKYARNTPEKYSHNIKDLADYLNIPAKNDLEKARLAFTWVATHIQYDAEAFNTGNYKNEFSADSVLMRRTAVCEGYSTLFMELGSKMNLEVVKIVGYAKGYGLKINEKFPETNHAWNAIRINNQWQLIDVTWGSGYGFTKENKMESVMEFDPYWFCVKPKECIFSHLPENNNWQLIHNSISLTQFEELPYLDKSFFELGFNSEDVFNMALSGKIKEFAQTYSIDFPIKKIELPMEKVIDRGIEYSFIFQSSYAEEMAIIDGGQWIYFKKENERFSIKHTPMSDNLEIGVKINWFDTKFLTIVRYKINDVKNSAAIN